MKGYFYQKLSGYGVYRIPRSFRILWSQSLEVTTDIGNKINIGNRVKKSLSEGLEISVGR